MKTTDQFDLFIFGSTSAVIEALISKHKNYFAKHVRTFHLVQRNEVIPEFFKEFKNVTLSIADCSNAEEFEKRLSEIVSKYVKNEIPMHVFPTYGTFKLDMQSKKPRFEYSRDGLQINLNSRLQILEAFRPYASNTKFHLFGSLFGSFPYMGGYANSMWYINKVVADPANKFYKDLDIVVHNLGGMMTKFWWSKEFGDASGPFVYKEIPTETILKHGFTHRKKGGEVYTEYPSFFSKVATFFGRKGLKPMDHQ
ncbi:MAG: hypothetical protein ACJA2M_001771 [Polaribacter sp.]|jgi:hypothetical protein